MPCTRVRADRASGEGGLREVLEDLALLGFIELEPSGEWRPRQSLVDELLKRSLAALSLIIDRSSPGELEKLVRGVLRNPEVLERVLETVCTIAVLSKVLEGRERVGIPLEASVSESYVLKLVEFTRELLAKTPEVRRALKASIRGVAHILLSLLELDE